ncbi:MAG: serine/threonine phosphatase [Cyanobacteria bacterium P01_H01_bin.162]
MFVCPHCQFENPPQNRFCQQCGNALKGLRAVITPTRNSERHPQSPLPETAPTGAVAIAATPEAAASPQVAQLLTADQRLRGEPRYQLRQPTAADTPLDTAEILLNLLDCEPASDSPLMQLLDNANEEVDDEALVERLPTAALAYWQLQDQFFPMVPELQAAWRESELTVVVVEDRSTWQTLSALLQSGEVEPLELVHWCYEILTLWDALIAVEAEPSLLEPNNLRVDDDQVVCLQRLIFNAGDRQYTLQDLGLLWQSLLQELAYDLPALTLLADQMTAGEMTALELVKAQLADIADELQGLPLDPNASGPSGPEAALPALDAGPITPGSEIAGMPLPPLSEDDAVPLVVDDLLLADELAGLAGEDDLAVPSSEDGQSDLPTMALPMKLYRLDEVGRTHIGRQRSHNEDSFFAETQLKRTDSPVGTQLQARGLYILCDGMGGHLGGEVASALAVQTLRDYFLEHWVAELPDETVIKDGILQANQAIFEQNEAEDRAGNARMGTTLVLLLVADHQAIVAHVGDSRLYLCTRQGLKQITVDHEVGQREVNRGVEPAIAYARPDAYQLTQALGPRDNDDVAPTITPFSITQDTLLLLCSDGLSDNDLLESHVKSHVEPMLRSRADLDEGIANLIDLANEHNGHDNITAIGVRVKLRPNLEAAQSMAESAKPVDGPSEPTAKTADTDSSEPTPETTD